MGDWWRGLAVCLGPQDDNELVDAIHQALELGMNWIDTAAVYGLGHSEEVVAKALKTTSELAKPYLFTKCSMVWDETRTISRSMKQIRRELEGSQKRLQIVTIDLYQISTWRRWSGR